MKKSFQSMLIIFLTYTFLCCPVFARSSYADDQGFTQPSPWEDIINRLGAVSRFISENLPDWIEDYTIPKTPSDVQANREKRNEIREGIRDAWNSIRY